MSNEHEAERAPGESRLPVVRRMGGGRESGEIGRGRGAGRLGATDGLERLKRASLRSQSLRLVRELGAFARRAEREAPEVRGRLRSAVEALQLLSARLGLDLTADLSSGAVGFGPGSGREEVF